MFFKKLLFVFLCLSLSLRAHISYEISELDDNNKILTVDFQLNNKRKLYKDSISFSIDSPDFKLSDWKTEQIAVKNFDKQQFKDNKEVFNKDTKVEITVTRNSASEAETADIFLTYLVSGKKSFQEKVITLNFKPKFKPEENIEPEIVPESNNINNNIITESAESCKAKNTENPTGLWSLISYSFNKVTDFLKDNFEKVKNYVWGNLQHSNSIWFKIFLAFMLGLMMSLTPMYLSNDPSNNWNITTKCN